MSTYTIHVNLKGSKVTVTPWECLVDPGTHHITWRPQVGSDKFKFDHPPVTFVDPHAPMQGVTLDEATPKCDDINQNNSGEDITYAYHLHLIVPSFPMTYPPKRSRSGPYIRNRPSKSRRDKPTGSANGA